MPHTGQPRPGSWSWEIYLNKIKWSSASPFEGTSVRDILAGGKRVGIGGLFLFRIRILVIAFAF
jgi:hypothetical protein